MLGHSLWKALAAQAAAGFIFVSALHALEIDADASIAQNIIRKIVLTTDGIEVQKIRAFAADYSFTLSQDIGEYWNVSGYVCGVNAIVTTTNGTIVTPQQSVFSASVSYNPSEMFQISLGYDLTSSLFVDKPLSIEALVESEPSLGVTFVAPIDSDWFSFSSVLTAAYYFSPYSRNFGFSIGLLPEFTIPAWDLTLGISATAGYSFAGYRGAAETGFDGITPALSLTWSPGDVFSLCLSAGYSFSLASTEKERILNSAPYYQLTAGFFLSGDKESVTDTNS